MLRWGITNPIHPMVPLIHTALAVKKLAQAITIPRILFTFIPSFDSVSPKDKMNPPRRR